MTDKDETSAPGPQAFPGSVAIPSQQDEEGSAAPDAEGRGAGGKGLRILAFDAGNTSGTALYDGGSLVLGQCRGREAAFKLLAGAGHLDALAYEQFVIRQPIKDAHATVVYVNGAIEYEAWRRGIPFYRYTPRHSKSRVSDALLQSLGWWPPFGLRTGGHAADAARILVCTLMDNYPMEMMDR